MRNALSRKRSTDSWSRRVIRLAVILSLPLVMAACATHATLTTPDAICRPWRAITYASKDKNSDRYAGKALVEDLRAHNFTGDRLGCWGGT